MRLTLPGTPATASHPARRLVVGAAVLCATVWGGPFADRTASAAGLVEALSGPVRATALSSTTTHAKRGRLVSIDLGYLESTLVPRGMDRMRNRLEYAPSAGSARIDLFPGVSLTLDRERLTKAYGGGYVWSGKVRGGNAGNADLVIANDQVTGQIQTRDAIYRIAPVGDGIHRIEEIDGGSFPGDIVLPSPSPSPDAERAASETIDSPQEKAEIRVIMPYTHAALVRVGAIDNAAQLAITRLNRTARDSNVRAKFRLVGTKLIKQYKDSEKSYSNTLRKATKGKGWFRKIHDFRDKKRADLVAILRTGNELCGIGWYNPDAVPAEFGYAVTNVDCITDQTVSHEIGHNAGLNHDRYVSATAPKSEFNFGYVNLGAEIMSVMAYYNECYENGKDCLRVGMFSTPRIKFYGAIIGVAEGKPGAADAARVLNRTLPRIAAFR